MVDDDSLALDAIAEVGPGGHFFGTAHTQARFRSEFYRPLISDWRNYETWQDAGSPQAAAKANQLVEAVPRASTSRRRWTPPTRRRARPSSSPAGPPRAASPSTTDRHGVSIA